MIALTEHTRLEFAARPAVVCKTNELARPVPLRTPKIVLATNLCLRMQGNERLNVSTEEQRGYALPQPLGPPTRQARPR